MRLMLHRVKVLVELQYLTLRGDEYVFHHGVVVSTSKKVLRYGTYNLAMWCHIIQDS
jgi:hypothetical protein